VIILKLKPNLPPIPSLKDEVCMMKNQKGLTLIELIAAITIFFIVSSLLFGVYISIQKNYQVQKNQNQIGQDANQIIALIKNYHQKRTSYNNYSYRIYYDSTSKITYIEDVTSKQPLGSIPQNVSIQYGMDQNFEREDEVIDYNPIYVKITITNQTGKAYIVDTIISNY
jgi:prepilin-type N-terminal cleavage/methylation domain-containing protein